MVRYIADENEESGQTLSEPAVKAYLVLVKNGRVSQTFALQGEVNLGRDKSNGVVIADQKVSRHHARLSFAGNENIFILNDQGSANGTYLNGVQISQPARLKDRDQIGIGDTTFLFATSLPDSDLVSDPVFLSMNSGGPAGLQSLVPIALFPFDNKPLWMIIGCLGLMVVALLLIIALMLGLFIGSSQTGILLLKLL